MGHYRFSTLLVFFTFLFLSGCGLTPNSVLLKTPSPTPGDPSQLDLNPLPPLAVEFEDLHIRSGLYDDEFRAIGRMINRSGQAIQNVKIRIKLLDAAGEVLTQQVLPIKMQRLKTGESSPFAANFISPVIPQSMSVEVHDYEEVDIKRARVQLEILEETTNSSGGLILLGRVSNPSTLPIDISALGLLAYNSEAELIEIGERIAGTRSLPPNSESMILIEFNTDPGEADFVIWQDCSITNSQPPNPFEIVESPKLLWTEQGHPFVVASIQNQDLQSRSGSIFIEILDDGEVLALSQVDLPIPIPPGQSIPVSVTDFPGFVDKITENEPGFEPSINLSIEPALEGSENWNLHSLDLEVMGFEAIGSSLFLDIIIQNPQSKALLDPIVLVALFDIEGNLLSAGWKEAGEFIIGNGTRQLVVNLPLPEGLDLAMAEYDLAAYGLRQ